MRTNLKNNESIVLLTSLHWYFLFVPFFITGIILILAILLYIKMGYSFEILAAVLLAGSGFIAYKLYERSKDILIVTTLRLIDEAGVFSVTVKENQLDKINNVSYTQSFLGRIFGYGNVEIQTAAEQGSIIYNGLKNPKVFCDALTTAQETYKQDLGGVHTHQPIAQTPAAPGPDTMECPYCAEIIKAKAKICRYCGKELK